jgi:hypothetical protein
MQQEKIKDAIEAVKACIQNNNGTELLNEIVGELGFMATRLNGADYIKQQKTDLALENEDDRYIKIENCHPCIRECYDLLYKLTFCKNNTEYKEGWFKITLKEIQDSLSWETGWHLSCYTKKQITESLEFINSKQIGFLEVEYLGVNDINNEICYIFKRVYPCL